MHFNLATTISLCAASTCLSLAVLGAYLGQAQSSRHFRYASAAGFAAALFCVTDAVVAGSLSVDTTVWAGRLTLVAAATHGAAWLAFLAAWDRRRLSRFEGALIVASLVAAVASLVPGVAVEGAVTERALPWAKVIYRDPDVGPMALPFLLLAYGEHVAAALTAFRMSRRNPRATVVAAALGLFCLVMPMDILSGMHVLALPYLGDPALALVFLSVGSVVIADAAESAAKSAELERARVAMAERENLAALGQLAAVVAHEVRNPVAIIFGALTTLKRTARSEDDAKLLSIIDEEAERLKHLVTRLLDAVRPFELEYSRHDVGQVLRDAITQVTSGTGAAPTQVVLAAAPTEEVECDAILLGQAIANLVQNAIVANGRRSPVSVRATLEPATLEPSSQPAMLRVEVADDGDGVALEARPLLFTPFFTTRATGTGLGLALVKRIAGAHGGTVDYEPSPGGGASFVLRVPLRAQDSSPKRLLGGDVR